MQVDVDVFGTEQLGAGARIEGPVGDGEALSLVVPAAQRVEVDAVGDYELTMNARSLDLA